MNFYLTPLACLLSGAVIGQFYRVSSFTQKPEGTVLSASNSTLLTAIEADVPFHFVGKSPFERQHEFVAEVADSGDLPRSLRVSEPFVTAIWAALMADHDPKMALDYLKADGYAEDIAARLIFRQWAKKDLWGAYEFATSLPKGLRQTNGIEAVLLEAVRHDRKAMVKILKSHYLRVRAACIAVLAVEAPEELCHLIKTLPGGALHPAGSNAPREWARTNPTAAWRWALSRSGTYGDLERLQVAAAWAEISPDAVSFLIDDPATPRRDKDYLERIVISGLAKSDPMEAMRRAMSLQGTNQSNAMHALIKAVSGGDLDMALSFVESVEDSEARKALMAGFLAEKARASLGGAVEWVEAQSDPSIKASAIKGFGVKWAMKDPGAVSHLLSEVPVGLDKDEHVQATTVHVARALAREDTRHAVAWARTLSGELQSVALGKVLLDWSKRDVKSAATYFGSLDYLPIPEGAVRDLAGRYFRTNPQEALEWMNGIKSESLRGFVESHMDQQIARSMLRSQMQTAGESK